MKSDFAGGQLPSNKFGVNAAWWWLMILSLNLTTILQILTLEPESQRKRMKSLRFRLLNIPGRIIYHCDQIILKIARSHQSYLWILSIRERILKLSMFVT